MEYVAAQSASAEESEQELSTVSGGLSPLAIGSIASGAVVVGAGVIAGDVWAFSPSKSPDSNFPPVRTQSFDSLLGDPTNLAAWEALKIEGSNL